MLPNSRLAIRLFLALICLAAGRATAEDEAPAMEVLVSVAEQKMIVLREGGLVQKYRISTSRFGLGDAHGSYKTPVGRMRVCEKYGDSLALGAVMKGRSATGEVLPVNAQGRDPIVTRILWLDGLEEQNRNAHARGVYIHGTPEEKNLGKPVSWGCIRMASKDVVQLFEAIPSGTPVNIVTGKLPRYPKYDPAKHQPVIVSQPPAPAASPAPATPAPKLAAMVGPEKPPLAKKNLLHGSILNAGLPEVAQGPTPTASKTVAFRSGSWSDTAKRP